MEQLLEDIPPPRDKVFDDLSKELRDGLVVPVLMGVASRNTFYIGPDGKVLAIDRNVNPASAAQDIAATLGKLAVPKRSR